MKHNLKHKTENMYHKEATINGVLCWRNSPDSEFKEYSKSELTMKYSETKRTNLLYLNQIEKLKEQVSKLSSNPI